MEPRGPRDAVVFTDDFEIESFIDSVLEVRESAVAGKEHYDADRPGARDMVSAIVSGAFVPVFGTMACRDLAAQVGGVFVSLGMMPHFVDIGPSLMSKVRPFHRAPPWCGRCI